MHMPATLRANDNQGTRYHDFREVDKLDEGFVASWIRQASTPAGAECS